MHILLPGPTPIPNEVAQAMLTPMSDHRGAPFRAVQDRVLHLLSELFQTSSPNDIAILPCSGTGGLEAGIQNLLMPGDSVLAIETGLFGRRFAEVAEAQSVHVDTVHVPWGKAFIIEEIIEQAKQKSYRAILVTHNETSTGVQNPVEALGVALRQLEPAPLFIVDSVSGVPVLPLTVQDGIDLIIAGSQKGFMCPPGLAILAFSPRGRASVLPERPGRFYFDLRPYLKGNLPYTPAVSLWYALQAALQLLAKEGASARLTRHQLLRDMVRAYAKAGGFTAIVSEDIASPTVTALELPPSLSPTDLRHHLEQQGLQISGGLGEWHHNVIRLGHVGHVDVGDVFAGLGILSAFMPEPERALAALYQITRRSRLPAR